MDVKRMHEMIEKLSECAKTQFEKGIDHVDTCEMGKVIDMMKDLSEAMYYRTLTKAMEDSDSDEVLEMFERYGDGGKRFYDHYRYSDGRFAPKGPYRRRNIGTDGETRKKSLKSLYMYTVSHIGKKHNIQILSTGKRRKKSAYLGYLFNSRIILQVPLLISGSQYRRTSASFSKFAINRPEAVQAAHLYPFRP